MGPGQGQTRTLIELPASGRALALLMLLMIAGMLVLLVLMHANTANMNARLATLQTRITGTDRQIRRMRTQLQPLATQSPPFFSKGLHDLQAVRADTGSVTLSQLPALAGVTAQLASGIESVLPRTQGCSRARAPCSGRSRRAISSRWPGEA